MIANKDFLKQEKSFWSQVKLISMSLGYSGKISQIKTYNIEEVINCLKSVNLRSEHLIDSANKITPEGTLLLNYFNYRANILINQVEPQLMNRDQAKVEFDK